MWAVVFLYPSFALSHSLPPHQKKTVPDFPLLILHQPTRGRKAAEGGKRRRKMKAKGGRKWGQKSQHTQGGKRRTTKQQHCFFPLLPLPPPTEEGFVCFCSGLLSTDSILKNLVLAIGEIDRWAPRIGHFVRRIDSTLCSTPSFTPLCLLFRRKRKWGNLHFFPFFLGKES